MFPAQPSDWTYATVLAVVTKYHWERGTFDFKAALNGRGDLAPSIRRTACAMANTGGGHIIFGVEDSLLSPFSQPVDRIVGIPIRGDIRKELGEKLANIIPPLQFEISDTPISIPSRPSDRGIVIAAIPESESRPHQVRDTGAFYRRGDGGNAVFMDYYEVRAHMLLTDDRQRKMRLLRYEIREYQRCVQAIVDADIWGWTVERFEPAPLKSLVIETSGLLPAKIGLLDDLYRLPSLAARINRTLDKYDLAPRTGIPTRPLVTADLSATLDADIPEMKRILSSCNSALNQHFGPFP